MAVINKQWSNGDALTLTTSAGGIAVSSVPNLTGADRQMTVRVQTTNPGTKAYKDIVVTQARQPVDTRGFWIHKDTNVKTYFDASADFIDTNGVMSRPGWIANAKEIRLCAGITDFKKYPVSQFLGSNYSPASHNLSYIFYVDDYYTPSPVEKIDFGSASAAAVYFNMFAELDQLTDVVLNSAVTKIEPAFFAKFASADPAVLKRVTIPASVNLIENGRYNEVKVLVFGGKTELKTIYTDPGNTTTLQGLLNGKGLPSGYQIIEQ